MDLSIIIVTYNSSKDIVKCLQSIIDNTKDISYEVCVVDNSSTDNTVDLVRDYQKQYGNIKLKIARNNGFNAGNNIGIKNTEGEYIALLNPDTILLNNAFKIILDNMKKIVNVGACGGTLYNADMTLGMSHGSCPSLKETLIRALHFRNDKTYYLSDESKKLMKVEFPSGADFVFKRELIKKIGLLDEDYFLYFDETDYAFKMKELRLDNYLFPEAKIIHSQGSSTESISEFACNTYFESLAKYLKKNVHPLEARLLIIVRILENFFKLLIFKILKNHRKDKINYYSREILQYRRVIRLLK